MKSNKMKKIEKAAELRKEMLEWIPTTSDDEILGYNNLALIGAFTAIIFTAIVSYITGCKVLSWVIIKALDAADNFKRRSKKKTLDEEEVTEE